MTSFNDRAASMNLDISKAYKGLYSYSDRFSEVVYRKLWTDSPDNHFDHETELRDDHDTDFEQVPKLAVFTKPIDVNNIDARFQYVGVVSDLYSFVGNDNLIKSINESISNTGTPIVEEDTVLYNNLTKMRSEITISSSQHIPIAGDVLPIIVVNNSYDGTKAASISFGLTMSHNSERLAFAFNLGELKQIHISNSNTNIEAPIESYLEVFSQNIGTMISDSFNKQLTEEEMLTCLDVIEDISKNRKKNISNLLKELLPDVIEGQPIPLPSSWQIFLSIIRFSSFEKNLNVKKLLENAAQSALVIPGQMFNVLKQLENIRPA